MVITRAQSANTRHVVARLGEECYCLSYPVDRQFAAVRILTLWALDGSLSLSLADVATIAFAMDIPWDD